MHHTSTKSPAFMSFVSLRNKQILLIFAWPRNDVIYVVQTVALLYKALYPRALYIEYVKASELSNHEFVLAPNVARASQDQEQFLLHYNGQHCGKRRNRSTDFSLSNPFNSRLARKIRKIRKTEIRNGPSQRISSRTERNLSSREAGNAVQRKRNIFPFPFQLPSRIHREYSRLLASLREFVTPTTDGEDLFHACVSWSPVK